MIEEARTPVPDQVVSLVAEGIASALGSGLEQHTALTWVHQIELVTRGSDDREVAGVTVSLKLESKASCKLSLTLDEEGVERLGELFRAPSVGAAEPWLAVVDSCRSSLNTALLSLIGSGVASCEPIPEPAQSIRLARVRFVSTTGENLSLHVAGDSRFLEVLMTAHAVQASQEDSAAVDDPKCKIDRVVDVPLLVTLRFGQQRLTLREVLALGTGSLVPLDRQVEEPVDLVLGERLLARGEVVIVDGNYGLRITEVMEGVAHRIQRSRTKPNENHGAGSSLE